MAWTTATDELRTFLSDGPTDKLRHRKKVFGECNGTNVLFKTLEFRRVTNFTSDTVPLGIWKNGVLLAPADVANDYVGEGDFELVTAPVDGDLIEATYYCQWFLDSEITTFLTYGSNFLGFGGDYTQTPSGLQPALIHFAAGEAYQKLALKWAEWTADTYRLDDNPREKQSSVMDQYLKLSEAMRKKAGELRKSYYERNDQGSAPLFGISLGSVRKMP